MLSSDEQRFAKPLDSLGDRENASQSPANPSGAGRAHVVLAVGMWEVTRLWYGWASANSARGGARARDRVLCAMGSRCGRLGSMATLGGGEITSGDGESAKVRRRGTTRNGRGDS